MTFTQHAPSTDLPLPPLVARRFEAIVFDWGHRGPGPPGGRQPDAPPR